MQKRILCLCLFVVLGAAFAFAEESITITTYYPSPYGSYNQLEVSRGVTYRPLGSTPNSDFREGELVYVDNNPADATPGEFYYYGGGAWVPQGGGGAASYTAWGITTCAPGWTVAYTGWVTTTLSYGNFAGNLQLTAGDTICQAGSLTAEYLTNVATLWNQGNSGAGARNNYAPRSCAVCVK